MQDIEYLRVIVFLLTLNLVYHFIKDIHYYLRSGIEKWKN